MFRIAEVIETKKVYKTKQKDDENNPLFDGSILIRLNAGSRVAGQVYNVWAAPATFNKRIPLIGEQVLVFTAPSTNNYTSSNTKKYNWFYFNPYNSVDDYSNHNFPKLWYRNEIAKPSKSVAEILNDKKEVGYTTKKTIGGYKPLQPYEGDDIWQGRFGQTIRMSRQLNDVNTPGTSIYEKQPTWQSSTADSPLMIISLRKPESGNSYFVENIKNDDASIYLASKHKLNTIDVGFKKNTNAIKIPQYDAGSQLILDSNRLVLNAKKDIAFLIGAKEVVVTSPKIILQTNKYNVSVDDLMDWLNSFIKEVWSLATASAMFTTMMGPTGPATNAANITKLHKADWTKKFKI